MNVILRVAFADAMQHYFTIVSIAKCLGKDHNGVCYYVKNAGLYSEQFSFYKMLRKQPHLSHGGREYSNGYETQEQHQAICQSIGIIVTLCAKLEARAMKSALLTEKTRGMATRTRPSAYL